MDTHRSQQLLSSVGTRNSSYKQQWYIYFAADDGNMDNHQIYVVENEAANPMEGTFVMKGRIQTDKDNNWAIHASTFEHDGQRYMIWCGWQKRRIDSETQCIYIATMENPWTLSSDRILISKPEYEWECQWVNPDGSKTAYPIHVNEAPQYFESKNKDKACIFYSASGSWTPYYCVGLLTADAKPTYSIRLPGRSLRFRYYSKTQKTMYTVPAEYLSLRLRMGKNGICYIMPARYRMTLLAHPIPVLPVYRR